MTAAPKPQMPPSRATYPDLAGKSVLITGGGSGIGAAFTEAFARQNAKVAFLDIAAEPSQALAKKIDAETGNAPHFYQCDVRDIAALRSSIDQAHAKIGDTSILINNAASDDRHSFESVTPEYWDERFATNLRHMFFAAKAIAPQMQRLGGGSIINMSSIIWRLAHTGLPAYITCKAAVMGLTRTQAREYGPHRIRVNAISPGAVWTERQIKLWYTPEFEQEMMKGQCLAVQILPDDIANMALFLASDAAAKCTAQDFTVDAGWS
jgi:NAD(P)-dependent dehydrogenase (short-subunit alcohol dehydrogenase family)